MAASIQEQIGFDPFSDVQPPSIQDVEAVDIGFDPFPDPVVEPEATTLGVAKLLGRGTAELPLGIAQFITERFDDDTPLGFEIEGQPITVGDLRRSISGVTSDTQELAKSQGAVGQVARFVPQILQTLPVTTGRLATSLLPAATSALGKAAALGAKGAEVGLRGSGIGATFAGAQPLSELDKEKAIKQRSEAVEFGGVVGAVAPFAIPAVTKTIGALGKAVVNPIKTASNIATSEISPLVSTTRKSMNEFFAKRGLQIETTVGGDKLTLGQLTGSRLIQGLESSLRRTSVTADKFFNKSQGQLRSGVNAVNRVLDKITPVNAGSEQLGKQVKAAFNKVTNSALKNRSAQAKMDFDVLDRASSGNKILDISPMISELDDIVAAGSRSGAADAEKLMATKAKEIVESLTPRISAKQYQELLARYGKGATGKLSIATDLTKGENIAISTRIFGKLKDGLDDNVERLRAKPLQRGDKTPELLQIARERYKHNSEAIEILESTRIAHVLRGQAGKFGTERVDDALHSMKPSELRQTLSILRVNAPETIPDIQRSFIQRAFDKTVDEGRVFASGLPPKIQEKRPIKFMARSFAKNLPDDDVMDMLFPAASGGKIKNEMGQIVDYITRVGQDTGMEGSQTFTLQEAGKVAGALTSFKKVAILAFESASKGRLADILIDSNNRKLLLEVMKKPDSQVGADAAAAISGILNAKLNEE